MIIKRKYLYLLIKLLISIILGLLICVICFSDNWKVDAAEVPRYFAASSNNFNTTWVYTNYSIYAVGKSNYVTTTDRNLLIGSGAYNPNKRYDFLGYTIFDTDSIQNDIIQVGVYGTNDYLQYGNVKDTTFVGNCILFNYDNLPKSYYSGQSNFLTGISKNTFYCPGVSGYSYYAFIVSSNGTNIPKGISDNISFYDHDSDLAGAINGLAIQNNNNFNNINNSINQTNNTLNNDNIDTNSTTTQTSSWGNMNASNGTITNLLTMPITLLNAYVNGMNSSCSPISLGTLFDIPINLPCVNIGNYLGAWWNVIDVLISGFMVFAIGKKLIKIFNDFTNLRSNQVDELYGGGN